MGQSRSYCWRPCNYHLCLSTTQGVKEQAFDHYFRKPLSATALLIKVTDKWAQLFSTFQSHGSAMPGGPDSSGPLLHGNLGNVVNVMVLFLIYFVLICFQYLQSEWGCNRVWVNPQWSHLDERGLFLSGSWFWLPVSKALMVKCQLSPVGSSCWDGVRNAGDLLGNN